MAPAPMGVFPGYGVNLARLNGADIEPIPVKPVQHQNQGWLPQLFNGYQSITTHKYPGDHYLRMLSHMQPGQNYRNLNGGPLVGPSPSQVTDMYGRSAGQQPTAPGGPGFTLGQIHGDGGF